MEGSQRIRRGRAGAVKAAPAGRGCRRTLALTVLVDLGEHRAHRFATSTAAPQLGSDPRPPQPAPLLSLGHERARGRLVVEVALGGGAGPRRTPFLRSAAPRA